ncbi:MAG: formylglycine-generating enzyme family protein [Pirellulaceae bacterium]
MIRLLWLARNFSISFASVALLQAVVHPMCSAQVVEDGKPVPVLEIADSEASSPEEMKPYDEQIEQASVKFEMLPIQGGTFTMGSQEEEDDRGDSEGPQHEVSVSPFWMSKTEISWDVYDVWATDIDITRREIMGLPSSPRDVFADKYQLSQPTKPYTDMTFGMGKSGYPAICMTQHAARTFCNWLSTKTGRYYRLPTEAEWEYACRAGTTTPFYFGKTLTDEIANYDASVIYADGPQGKESKTTTPVDHFGIANAFGLSDMHGNVWEWCQDHWHDNYEKAPKDGSAWLTDNEEANRVYRGGSWATDPRNCRSAYRGSGTPDFRYFIIGFRLCCSAPRA